MTRQSTPPSPGEAAFATAGTVAVALIPAAGASRRMGTQKLLLPFGSSTILGSTLDALRDGGCGRLVVVVAPDAPPVHAEVVRHGAVPVVNPDPSRGMLSSIQTGIAALRAEDEPSLGPLVVCPADLPALTASTVAQLLAAWREDQPDLLIPTCEGRRGHPLLIAPALWPAVDRLDPQLGLRQLLDGRHGTVRSVAVDDRGIWRDVDTPADLSALRQQDRPTAEPRSP